MGMLCQELVNEATSTPIRQSAGLMLKNALQAKVSIPINHLILLFRYRKDDPTMLGTFFYNGTNILNRNLKDKMIIQQDG
jgi:hypothetical protein